MESEQLEILKALEYNESYEEMLVKIQSLYGWSPRKTRRAMMNPTFRKKLYGK